MAVDDAAAKPRYREFSLLMRCDAYVDAALVYAAKKRATGRREDESHAWRCLQLLFDGKHALVHRRQASAFRGIHVDVKFRFINISRDRKSTRLNSSNVAISYAV